MGRDWPEAELMRLHNQIDRHDDWELERNFCRIVGMPDPKTKEGVDLVKQMLIWMASTPRSGGIY
jgi:hypothetical protein